MYLSMITSKLLSKSLHLLSKCSNASDIQKLTFHLPNGVSEEPSAMLQYEWVILSIWNFHPEISLHKHHVYYLHLCWVGSTVFGLPGFLGLFPHFGRTQPPVASWEKRTRKIHFLELACPKFFYSTLKLDYNLAWYRMLS